MAFPHPLSATTGASTCATACHRVGVPLRARAWPWLAACLLSGTALAQTAAPSPPAPDRSVPAPVATPATTPNSSGEPVVRRNVVEDDNARIEELNVRGAVRSTRVQPKGLIKAEYEVLQMDAGRDITAGPSSARGAAGQSVWRVLSF